VVCWNDVYGLKAASSLTLKLRTVSMMPLHPMSTLAFLSYNP
jgi:hypothetical protein